MAGSATVTARSPRHGCHISTSPAIMWTLLILITRRHRATAGAPIGRTICDLARQSLKNWCIRSASVSYRETDLFLKIGSPAWDDSSQPPRAADRSSPLRAVAVRSASIRAGRPMGRIVEHMRHTRLKTCSSLAGLVLWSCSPSKHASPPPVTSISLDRTSVTLGDEIDRTLTRAVQGWSGEATVEHLPRQIADRF